MIYHVEQPDKCPYLEGVGPELEALLEPLVQVGQVLDTDPLLLGQGADRQGAYYRQLTR